MKKVFWTILSLIVVAALVVGGLREFSPLMDKQVRGAVAEQVQQFQWQGHGFKQDQWQQFGYADRNVEVFANAGDRGYNNYGQWNYGQWNYGGQRGWRGHYGFFGLLLGLVSRLLIFVGGWALWKRGGRLRRWIGGLLMVLAAWPLVEMTFGIAVVGGLVYWIWRSIRKKQESVEDFAIAMPLDNPFPTSKYDSLDQWEAKTRRELNDKKEEE